jgi:heme/copper-type cytochrome/quinol oxidase subunit 1
VFNVNEIDTLTGDAVAEIVPWAFFNLLPLLGVVIVLLMSLFLAKPIKGRRPNLTPAMVFGFLGAGMVTVGMFGNAMLSIADLDLQGSTFEEGTLVYVTYGLVLGALGGAAYWAPKLWGRELADAKVLPLALVGVLATVLAALPNYIAGFDKARDVYSVVIAAGHGLMALTVLGFVGLLAQSVRSGDNAVDDPYDGQTLEWSIPSPAPLNNFVQPPTVMSAEPLVDSKPNYGQVAKPADADEKGAL